MVLYKQGCSCDSAEQAAATLRQYLYAIPTQTPTPCVPSTNTTRLADVVRRGLAVVKQLLVETDEREKERLLGAWTQEVDVQSDLLAMWREAGLYSIQRRIALAFQAKHLITSLSDAPMAGEHAVLLLQQSLRLLGFVNLIESFVGDCVLCEE